jgi:hypothetical protein
MRQQKATKETRINSWPRHARTGNAEAKEKMQ